MLQHPIMFCIYAAAQEVGYFEDPIRCSLLLLLWFIEEESSVCPGEHKI
jgi:hypothetical protein